MKSNAVRVLSLVLVVLLVTSAKVVPFTDDYGHWSGAERYGESLAQAAEQTEKMGGGLSTLRRHREQGLANFMPELKEVLKVMDQLGGAKVGIWFDHKLNDQEVKSLESGFGVKFTSIGGRIQKGPIYSAVVPWDSIVPVSQLSYVKQIESYVWPPPAPAMDTSIPAVKANSVWPLQDGQGKTLTGKGIRVATFDTGVDIFHPALWQPDPGENPYSWTDLSGNGYFTPGEPGQPATATILWNGQSIPLRHINAFGAPGNGLGFEPNLDWLYADLNGNGIRDYGIDQDQWLWPGGNGGQGKVISVHNGTPGSNFSENDKSYGEPIFAANESIVNGRLDSNETLIALSVSKVFMTYFYMSQGAEKVSARRGNSANPLIMTPGDANGHGTSVAGILYAGVQATGNRSRYTGMAPDPVIRNAQGQWEGGLMVAFSSSAIEFPESQAWIELLPAQDHPRIMLYEQGVYHKHYLDGTDLVEQKVKELADAGIVQVIPAGNLAINPSTGNTGKHFQVDVTGSQPQKNVTFRVPAGSSYTYMTHTVLWTNSGNLLTFKFILPSGNIVNIGMGNELPETFSVYGYNFSRKKWGPSSRGVVRVELDINPTLGERDTIETGDWALQVTRGNNDQEVNGYLWDRSPWYQYWWGGIEYIGLDPARNSKTVMFPATADKAIVVAAYDDVTGNIQAYSGRGPRIDGTQIVDIAAPSDGTYTAGSSGSGNPHGGYVSFSGTSAAGPHVAGAAALMLQANSTLTHDDVESRLKAAATKDSFTGDPPDANTWGSGKLNVYDALRRGDLIVDKDGVPPQEVTVAVGRYFSKIAVPAGISSYQARIDYDGDGIQILDIRGISPFNNPGWIPGSNPMTVSASQQGSQPQPPLDLFKIVPKLNGSSAIPRTVKVSFPSVMSGGGANSPSEASKAYTWQRGDAQPNGAINIIDCLFIAQYLAGLRNLGDQTGTGSYTLVHPVNAASPMHDGGAGDQITIQDALYIAQMLAGLRDASYGWITLAPQGGGSRSSPLTGNTTVETGSATLAPGGTAQIPVTIRNIGDSWGLGAYNFTVTFNPQVIRVDRMVTGAFAAPTKKIDNTNGAVVFNAYQSDVPGPTGDVIVAYLNITALGGSGNSTPLNISITTLSNGDGAAIPATDIDGTVTIQ